MVKNKKARNKLCLEVFSAQLKRLMKKRNFTIIQMAEFCRVSPSTFSQYYHGKADPKLSVVMLIAYKLNVTVDELCDIDAIKLACWENKEFMWERY